MSATIATFPGSAHTARRMAGPKLREASSKLVRALRHLDDVSITLAAGEVRLSCVGASDEVVIAEAVSRAQDAWAAYHAIHLELHAPENHRLTPGDSEDLEAALRTTLRANEDALPDLDADARATLRGQVGF